jgi:hypothetical protein
VIASACSGIGLNDSILGVPLLGGREAAVRPKPHDLDALRTSGYLERLGFEYRTATPATMFRHPSKLGLAP